MIIENPTKNQLKTLKGIIYLIMNKVNNMKYVGKTTRTFWERYRRKNWWESTHNEYLKNSANKYGSNNFEISILEYDINNEYLLLIKETKYIKQFNSLYPFGYNFLDETSGKQRHSEISKRKMSDTKRNKGDIYIKEISSGKIKKFSTRKEIITQYGVAPGNLSALFLGKARTCKNICLPETNPNFWRINPSFHKIYTVLDQNNNSYTFFNLLQFSQEQKCNKTAFWKLFNGKRVSVTNREGKIFRLPSTDLTDPKYLTSIRIFRKYKQVILINIKTNQDIIINFPDGKEKLLKEYNMKEQRFYELIRGVKKIYRNLIIKQIIFLTRH